MTSRLTPQEIAALEVAPFTYPDVGATAAGAPPGYRVYSRSRMVHRDLRSARDRLFTWNIRSVQDRIVSRYLAASDA
jgi:uncharacterized protein (UPF0548 family)